MAGKRTGKRYSTLKKRLESAHKSSLRAQPIMESALLVTVSDRFYCTQPIRAFNRLRLEAHCTQALYLTADDLVEIARSKARTHPRPCVAPGGLSDAGHPQGARLFFVAVSRGEERVAATARSAALALSVPVVGLVMFGLDAESPASGEWPALLDGYIRSDAEHSQLTVDMAFARRLSIAHLPRFNRVVEGNAVMLYTSQPAALLGRLFEVGFLTETRQASYEVTLDDTKASGAAAYMVDLDTCKDATLARSCAATLSLIAYRSSRFPLRRPT